jgi:RNA polymerase sigma-70 factor, ECF subfamily
MAIEAPAVDALESVDDGRARRPVAADGAVEPVPILERLLVARLRRGDAKAFRQLVAKHQDRVYSICLRMLGDPQEAEDVAQEVFAAVHRHLPRFRGDCRLSTWTYRVAKNQCLNRLKYLERREAEGGEALARASPSDAAGFVSVPDRPDQALLGAEERAEVQRALTRLSAEHRLIVVLRDIEGLSYEEIGRITDLPPGTVKSRLHRARSCLADALEAAGMAPVGGGR